MVPIGVIPLGFVATGRAQLVVAGYSLGASSGFLGTALIAIFTLCGLILAAAGVNVVRDGRPESNSTSLH